MSIAKVIEIICEGKTIEEAINAGLAIAGKTIRNITHVDIDHVHANVSDNKVTSYRVIAQVSFVVE